MVGLTVVVVGVVCGLFVVDGVVDWVVEAVVVTEGIGALVVECSFLTVGLNSFEFLSLGSGSDLEDPLDVLMSFSKGLSSNSCV